MRCSDARDNLGRLADGELDPAAARLVEAHLAGCPACEAERVALVALGARLSALPPEPVPAGLEASILQAARFRTPRSVPTHRPALALLGRVAAAVLIALSGLYLGLRLSAVQQVAAASPSPAVAADPLAPDTAPFQLVPPGSPGALCLALAVKETP